MVLVDHGRLGGLWRGVLPDCHSSLQDCLSRTTSHREKATVEDPVDVATVLRWRTTCMMSFLVTSRGSRIAMHKHK